MRYVISLLVAAALVAIAVLVFALVLRPREMHQSKKLTTVPIVLGEKLWTCPQRVTIGKTQLPTRFVLDASPAAAAAGGTYTLEKAMIQTGVLRTWSEEERDYRRRYFNGDLTCSYRPVLEKDDDVRQGLSIALHLSDSCSRAEPTEAWVNKPWIDPPRLPDPAPIYHASELSPPPFSSLPDVIGPAEYMACFGSAKNCPFYVRAELCPASNR